MHKSRLERSVKITLIGLVTNAVLALGKMVAGVAGNSHALIADAVESLADLLSSLVVWRAVERRSQGHQAAHGMLWSQVAPGINEVGGRCSAEQAAADQNDEEAEMLHTISQVHRDHVIGRQMQTVARRLCRGRDLSRAVRGMPPPLGPRAAGAQLVVRRARQWKS